RRRARPVPRPRTQRAALLRPPDRTSARDVRPDALMLEAAARSFFHALAGSHTLQRLASSVGMRKPTSFARRFIAGDSLTDAIAAARAIQAAGLFLTLDHLGENVTNRDEADAATRHYLHILQTM